MTQQPGAPAAGVDYEGLREQYATQKEAELAAEEGDVVTVSAYRQHLHRAMLCGCSRNVRVLANRKSSYT